MDMEYTFDDLIDRITQYIDDGMTFPSALQRGKSMYNRIEEPDFDYSDIVDHMNFIYTGGGEMILDEDGEFAFMDNDADEVDVEDDDLLDIEKLDLEDSEDDER